ncbi:hypothetical protein V6Z12_A06G145800 [Gossypium hirsutum]
MLFFKVFIINLLRIRMVNLNPIFSERIHFKSSSMKRSKANRLNFDRKRRIDIGWAV